MEIYGKFNSPTYEVKMDISKSSVGQKESFSINYKGGEIWIEHLDSIQNPADITEKFLRDLVQIKRPSTSSFIAINFDESNVNADILNFIIDALCKVDKPIRKVVIIGLKKELKKIVSKRKSEIPLVIKCIDDFEKAKEWLY